MDSVFVLIGLMLACAVLIQLAHRLGWPSPLVVFLGGCVLGVPEAVPSMPIAPEVMIPLFLPPLLMAAAYYTSWRDFRFNMRPILLLAVGLVLATAAAVGFTIHWLQPAIPLVVALLIGTIVSPPDAVAASAVLKTMRVPRRVVTVLEGESLLNDATGLVMYQLAVVAVVGGVAHPPALQRIHSHYRDKLDALGDGPNTPLHGQEQEVALHPVIEAERAIWVRIIEAERQTVLEMRRRFAMNDDVMHTLLREIDRSYAKFVAHPQG